MEVCIGSPMPSQIAPNTISSSAGNRVPISPEIEPTLAKMQYQFYQPNGSAWTESNNLSVTGSGAAQSANYTLKINPTQSNQPAGTYSDTVLVTVSY